MKPEEKLFFETFMSIHPDFLDARRWRPGPEPPDVIITDVQNRQIGVELTEWLDKRQTTPSIGDQENQMKWLAALDTENRTPPQNFQAVSIWFRSRARFSPKEAASFRQEFYKLMSHVDGAWEREMADTPAENLERFLRLPHASQARPSDSVPRPDAF